MAETPTIIYQLRLERMPGPHYREVEDTVDGETFNYFAPEPALERGRSELTTRPGPVVTPDSVEIWQAQIEALYYCDEHGEPLPPMSMEQYYALENQGEAELSWVDGWDMPWLQQELPAHAPAPEVDLRAEPHLPAPELIRAVHIASAPRGAQVGGLRVRPSRLDRLV